MVFVEEDEEETKPKNKISFPKSMFVSEGRYYQKLSKFQTAINCFEEGLKVDSKNVLCLVGKAQCLIRLGHYDEAKSCAEEAMKLNPESPEARYVKGDSEFYGRNYEDAFEVFVRSSNRRPNDRNLKKGRELCWNVMDSYNPEVLSNVETDEVEMEEKKRSEDKPPKSKRKKIPHSNIALWRRNYLSDIEFTEELLKDVKDSTRDACEDLWVYLNTLRKVRVSQNPKKSKKKKQGDAKARLQECEKAYKEGDTKKCILRGYQTLESVNSLPAEQRKKLEAKVFHLMGLSYITKNELGSAMDFLKKELRISNELNSPELKFRSWRAIGEVHLKSRRYDEAKDAFATCLQFQADSEEEFLWFEECYTPGKSLDGSTSCENASLDVKLSSSDDGLDIDLQMLLAEIAIREKRIDDAMAIYRNILSLESIEDDSRGDDVRSQLQSLERESTDNSEASMVTCLSELLDNVTSASSQENSS